MQRFAYYVIITLALSWLASAADYTLKDGTVLSGTPISFTDKGVVVKNDDNKVLPRTAWTNFTQAGLKEFAKNPKARPFVETLIDEPPPGGDATEGAVMNVPEVAVIKRPPPKWAEVQSKPVLPEKPGIIAGMFTTGVGWLSLLVIYAAIIYAGYEVALYRRRPVNQVMGLAAIPFVGICSPIAFLAMPPVKSTQEKKPGAVEQVAQQSEQAGKEEEKKGMAPGKARLMATAKPVATSKPGAPAAAPGPAPVVVKTPGAPAASAPPAALAPAVYRRGETNINKRFIETKFAGFFKAVLGPAEKEMWLVWVTATGGEYWSKRVVSINQTEVVVNCPQEGGGSLDQTLQIVEIQEIHLRPREG